MRKTPVLVVVVQLFVGTAILAAAVLTHQGPSTRLAAALGPLIPEQWTAAPEPPAAELPAPTTTSPGPLPAPTPQPVPVPQPMDVEPAAQPQVVKTAVLGDVDLAGFQNAVLPASMPDDRGLSLGGLGSGMFNVGDDTYWTVSDRGPNGEPSDHARSFLVPAFDPSLVKVKVQGDRVDVIKTLPLMTSSGREVTGLPPFIRPGDPKPILTDGSTSSDLVNPDGVDTEGVVATAKGFWIVDEYGPSILSVSPQGTVLSRYVPQGTKGSYAGAADEIVDNLPAELAGRTPNRGFEDIALLPDGKTIVVALQSPLAGQTESLTTKLLVFDTEAKSVVATYDYVFDRPGSFVKEPGKAAKAKNLKISALVAVDQDHVLVQERTDMECRFYEVSLGDDKVLSGPDKRMIVNLAGLPGVPQKVESAVLKDANTLALMSDNDFGFNTESWVPPNGDIPLNGVKTTYVEVKLH